MPSTPDTFSNYALSTVAGGNGGQGSALNAADTTLLLTSGDGAKFPATGPFMLLVGTLTGVYELVKATARTTDTCTIVRGQESTTALTWAFGTPVQQVATAGNLSNLWAVSPMIFNVKGAAYGAKGDGVTNDTTAIQAAISAAQNAGGGVVLLPPGTYLVSSSFTISVAGVVLMGSGRLATTIQPTPTFVGTQIINITADFCGVRDLTIAYANTTYSSNPTANGIQVTGARSVLLDDLAINYINGWAVQSSATAVVANYWTQLRNVHTFQCAQGIHVLGVSGSGYAAAHSLINCNTDQCQNGDGFLIEDAHDIFGQGLFGTVAAGSGSVLHIKGNSYAVYVTCDLGIVPGPSTGPTALIESGPNGAPNQITFAAGILEGGASGITISAGTNIRLNGMDVYNNGTYGANITGGDGIVLHDCAFSGNGSAGTAGRYDLQASSTGHVDVADCVFATAQGSTTGKTNNVMNVTAGTVVVHDCQFIGVGYTSANIFAGFPKVIRNCTGYNPIGNFAAPVIGASPFTAPTKSTDNTVFVTGGTVSQIAIGGVATGLTAGAFRVPASQTITVTYTVAPTWAWFGD